MVCKCYRLCAVPGEQRLKLRHTSVAGRASDPGVAGW